MTKQTEKNQIDFIGIGAQKSGTTWLFKCLSNLPEFELLPIKELHYFDRDTTYPTPNTLSETHLKNRITDITFLTTALKSITYQFKKKSLKKVKFYLKWYFSNYDDDWYLSLFNDIEGHKGEITPSYSILEQDDVIKMHQLAPNAKIILLFRNPIDRAWSHYRFKLQNSDDFNPESKLNTETIIQFIESEEQSLRSNYLRTIENYSNVYPKNQILIGFYDSIYENPEALIHNITEFIGGESSVDYSNLDLRRVENKSIHIDYPKEIEQYLKDKYYDQIKQMAEQYGGYFNHWFEKTYGETIKNAKKDLSPTMHLK
ncbi:MAG: sulfotransferase domain-containing protein [Psychroserpens sp.]|nr:sulfotransferase domain-containing protein [Psychroserpens sp.]